MIRTAGTWWDYSTVVDIDLGDKIMEITDNGNVEYELLSNDKPNPARCKVTLYNISPNKTNQITKGQHITVYSGPKDLYGIIAEGTVIKLESNNDGGRDRAVVITFVESNSPSGLKLNPSAKGVTTTRNKKTGKTRVNLAYKKPVHASTLIKKIARASGIKIYHLALANNKLYKRGYTVSNRPFSALTKLAKDCGSEIYQRRGKLVIDDYSVDNPYDEHIYFEIGSGLLSEPSVYDKYGNRQCYVLECFDDPRVQAGSSIQIQSQTISGLHRVQSVTHTHQGGYDMEVVVYG